MTSRARIWAAIAVGAILVTAVAVVAVWSLSRPAGDAGESLAAVRAESSLPSASPSAAPSGEDAAARESSSLPRPVVRDAGLDAVSAVETAPPARLVIPDLDVDASVEPVGVQADGAMVIPASPTSVGWYQYGSTPSDAQGNTVIAGHVATREDGPGALSRLTDAEPGMRVEVTDADGVTHTYEVVGREAIVKAALPVEEVFARDGRPLLVLVTCGGEYNPELRSHRDNIVVTAVPVA